MTRLKGGRKKRGRGRDSEDEDGSEEGSESGSESESESEEGGLRRKEDGLEMFEGNREECKLVLVVRTDLGMSKGVFYHFFLLFLLLFPFPSLSFSSSRSALFHPLPSPFFYKSAPS